MGGQSGSWTPTKRRGPIAAEFQGPGPAALSLPSLFGSKYNWIQEFVMVAKPYYNSSRYLSIICVTEFENYPLITYCPLRIMVPCGIREDSNIMPS